ncbi:ABC transporter ATP-binding protein [Affinibrenneria salicis]|uniref:ABC transporter ATP-binding protein n=1 Tax=Affinibrenneria salicis TaxID=2590031 RepID=A0A5J5G3G7_9GAMM|nr:ABC transporter ATP-binding protein [Affinibrenneria salicis]KAA9001290.1 ABC transporter ATP-binding protein [Affinibrenneria salicis]
MSSIDQTSAEAPVVTIRGLVKAYGSRVVLNKLNLTIARGEFVALLGESGCGKTTLLRTIAGLDPVQEGRINAPDSPAVVFQEHRLLPWESIWRNVTLGMRNVSREEAKKRAGLALEAVGLGGRLTDWPRNLSGGQAQRVAIARAFVQQPRILLLDEPFASLDALTRIKMHNLLKKLIAGHRPGVLLVTHDVQEAMTLATRILIMKNGQISDEYRVDEYRDGALLHKELLAQLGVAASE